MGEIFSIHSLFDKCWGKDTMHCGMIVSRRRAYFFTYLLDYLLTYMLSNYVCGHWAI